MTHERTMQTMKWALLLSVLVGAAWGACGCGLFKSPTASDEPELHPNEILITEYVQCYAEYFGLKEVWVDFWEHGQHVDCSEDHGEGAMCPIAGHAHIVGRGVSFWGPWVRGEASHVPPDLEWAAAHEVCHLTGLWDEAATKLCTELVWDEAGCHEGDKPKPGWSCNRGET